MLWSLSNKVIESSSKKKEIDKNLKIDQIIILSLVGFYLLPQGTFELTRDFISEYSINQLPTNNPFNTGSSQRVYLYIFASIIKIVISLSLIFKAKGWAYIFKKIR